MTLNDNEAPKAMTREELQTKVLKFDLARAETGREVVTGRITPEEADKRFESDLDTVMAAVEQYANQRVMVALKATQYSQPEEVAARIAAIQSTINSNGENE